MTDSTQYWLSFAGQSYLDEIPESVTLFTPEFDPSNLSTMFYLRTEGSPYSYYWQEFTGPVPAALTKLEGELTVTSTSPDSLAFTTTSSWDRFTAFWYQRHDLPASWFVEGPAPIQNFVLPRLPEDRADLFSDYPSQGFTLSTLEIYQVTTEDMVRSQGKDFPVDGVAEPPERHLTEVFR